MGKKTSIVKRMVYWIAAAVVIAILLFIVIVCKNDLSPQGIKNRLGEFFSGGSSRAEVSYDGGMECLVSALGDSVVMANSSGVNVYSTRGELLYSKALDFKDPAIRLAGKYGVVCDIGGTSAAVLTSDSLVTSIVSEHEILSASVNEHGIVTICAAETTYKSSITVYNTHGEMLYKWYSAKGYVVDAALSENNADLAAAVLTEGGSEIVRLDISTTEEISRTMIPNEAVIRILWNGGGNITAVVSDGVIIVDADGTLSENKLESGYLSQYDSGEDYTAFLGGEYEGSTSNRLFVFSNFGEAFKPVELEGTVADLCVSSRYIAVLCSGRILVYNTNMRCCAQYEGAEDAKCVLIMKDGSILAAGDYYAWSPERVK